VINYWASYCPWPQDVNGLNLTYFAPEFQGLTPVVQEVHVITDEEFKELRKHGCGPHDVG
jgi:hypothetical protein